MNADPAVCEFLPGTLTREQSDALVDRFRALEAEHGFRLPDDFGERVNRTLFARFETELEPIDGVREAILALLGSPV